MLKKKKPTQNRVGFFFIFESDNRYGRLKVLTKKTAISARVTFESGQ